MTTLKDKAAAARSALEETIVAVLPREGVGLNNGQIARALGLESDYEGRQRNYLTYSLLGGLLERGLVTSHRDGRSVRYTAR